MKFLKWLFPLICSAPLFAASPIVYIVFSSSTVNQTGLASDLMASTTRQYNATLTPSPYFQNMTIVTVRDKNAAYSPPVISTQVITLDQITKQLTKISTWTYVYGWADGEDYARAIDIGELKEGIKHCENPDYFDSVVSTDSWNYAICHDVLTSVGYDIADLNKSTPTFVAPK